MTKSPNKKGALAVASAAPLPDAALQGGNDGVNKLNDAAEQAANANGGATDLTLTGDKTVIGSQDNAQSGQPLEASTSQQLAGGQAGADGNQGGDTSAKDAATDTGGAPMAGHVQAQVLDIAQAESNLPPTSDELLHAADAMLDGFKKPDVYGVEISSTRDGFRRAGRAWYREPTFIQHGDLSEEQVSQLLAEPNIRCVPARRPAVSEGEQQ